MFSAKPSQVSAYNSRAFSKLCSFKSKIIIRPPRFVVFGTRLDMLPKSYERYLVNGIRDKLGFDAVPVRVVLKSPKNPFQKE